MKFEFIMRFLAYDYRLGTHVEMLRSLLKLTETHVRLQGDFTQANVSFHLIAV